MSKRMKLSIETSADTLWLNAVDGHCVSRYGKHGFEMEGHPGHGSKSVVGMDVWATYRALVKQAFGLELNDGHCPVEIRKSNNAYREEDDQLVEYLVKISEVKTLTNPFRTNPWTPGRITPKHIDDALKANKTIVYCSEGCNFTREQHIERIAFMVKEILEFGHLDAIIFSCNIDGDNVSLIDGYHRVAAAIYCLLRKLGKTKTIRVGFDGFEDGFLLAFPSAKPAIGLSKYRNWKERQSETTPERQVA